MVSSEGSEDSEYTGVPLTLLTQAPDQNQQQEHADAEEVNAQLAALFEPDNDVEQDELMVSSEGSADSEYTGSEDEKGINQTISTKNALVMNGYYICDDCGKNVSKERSRHLARAYNGKYHKYCRAVLKM